MTAPDDIYLPDNRGWLPTSPEQIRHHRFGRVGFPWRGYKTAEVDLYLAKLAREVDHWTTRCSQLQAEVHRLRNWYRDHDMDAVEALRRQVSVDAANLLVRAQQQADQIIAIAHTQARMVQSDARSDGPAILELGRRDAEQAAQDYRARSGSSYNPEREELERWAVWGRSLLAAINEAKAQLEATGDALAFELVKPSQLGDMPSNDGPLYGEPPGGEGTPDATLSTVERPAPGVVHEQMRRPRE